MIVTFDGVAICAISAVRYKFDTITILLSPRFNVPLVKNNSLVIAMLEVSLLSALTVLVLSNFKYGNVSPPNAPLTSLAIFLGALMILASVPKKVTALALILVVTSEMIVCVFAAV